MRETQGWHFSVGALGYEDGRPIVGGETYSQEYPHRGFDGPTLCDSGMHASERIIDALRYAPGMILSRVTLLGDVARADDKMVATSRRHEWMIDARPVLQRWSCWVADRAVRVHAVAALRSAGLTAEADRLAGLPEIVDEQTALAARDAAEAAEAAGAAAWAAARAAAWAAAGAAAWAAASAAAWAAKAAGEAAGDAERDIQETRLVEMVTAARAAERKTK